MTLSLAVWLVILSALVMANLPFVLERPLAAWGWAPSQGRQPGMRWLRCAGFVAGLAVWSWGTLEIVGGAFAGGGSSAAWVFLKLLVSIAVVVAWLYWPGLAPKMPNAPEEPPARAVAPAAGDRAGAAKARQGARSARAGKPFIDRLLEVLMGYMLVGTLGHALERTLGNAFTQRWEFYAVTLALFLVLAYPGFVWHYMMRKRRGH